MNEMKSKIKSLIKDGEYQESANYLLSQELDFQYAKSFLTFAMAFIGGIVTLKTALAIDTPLDEGFSFAIGAAVISAILSFDAQHSIIKDLQLGRTASKLRMYYRRTASPLILGLGIGFAVKYFNLTGG